MYISVNIPQATGSSTKDIGTDCMLMCQEDCQTKTCCNENQPRRRKSATDGSRKKSETTETSPNHQVSM